jgi:hypothetical protein
MNLVTALLTLASSLLLALAGCGSQAASWDGSGKAVAVKGTVTYRGRPLTKGIVRFEPDAGREAEGEIQADGTYALSLARPGINRVAVTAPRRAIPARYSNFM